MKKRITIPTLFFLTAFMVVLAFTGCTAGNSNDQVGTLENEVSSLKKHVSDLENDVAELKKKNEAFESEMQVLKGDINSLKVSTR